jgi:tripartite-type tricarboxylate transporter receptor subunit TctC
MFVGPANTPRPIVYRISEAAIRASKDKDLQARLIEQPV